MTIAILIASGILIGVGISFILWSFTYGSIKPNIQGGYQRSKTDKKIESTPPRELC
jgi:hypothetical protein